VGGGKRKILIMVAAYIKKSKAILVTAREGP
jgi:hypothetical protein